MALNLTRADFTIGVSGNAYTLAQPSLRDIRKYYENQRAQMKMEGDRIKHEMADNSDDLELVSGNLIAVVTQQTGLKYDEDLTEIKMAMRAPSAKKLVHAIASEMLFVECFDEDSEEAEEPKLLSFRSLFTTKPIVVSAVTWDLESGQEVETNIVVDMDEPNKVQAAEYERARPLTQKKKRKSSLEQEQNVPVIERLFKARVTAIRNAVFGPDARECTNDCKADWFDLVPYNIITSVMAHDATLAEVGNG